jgi:hypothetical protein
VVVARGVADVMMGRDDAAGQLKERCGGVMEQKEVYNTSNKNSE